MIYAGEVAYDASECDMSRDESGRSTSKVTQLFGEYYKLMHNEALVHDSTSTRSPFPLLHYFLITYNLIKCECVSDIQV